MKRAAVLVALLLASGSARAGGFGIPEIGVRRTAMGSIIGRPDDPSAIYHNPGGLVLSHGWRFYMSAGLALLRTSFALHTWDGSTTYLSQTPGADGYYAAAKPTRALGVIPLLAVTGEILPDRLVVGASAFVGNAQGAAFSASGVTKYHLIDGYVVAPQAVLGASYRVLPTLAVGATAGVVNIRIHGERDVYPIVNGSDVSSILGRSALLELDGSGWAPTWQVGLYGNPTPRLTWGLTVTGRVDATLSGPVSVAPSSDAKDPSVLSGQQTTNEMLPWSAGAGANVDVTPQLELGGEGRYWLYRQWKEQTTEISGIYLVRELVTEKDYHDSWEVSGGARLHALASAPGLEAMMGLQYDHSPAPTATLTLDSPSFSHVGLHSGVRYEVGRWRLGASYIHYWYRVPTITDSITDPPTDVKGSGSNHIFTLSLEAKL